MAHRGNARTSAAADAENPSAMDVSSAEHGQEIRVEAALTPSSQAVGAGAGLRGWPRGRFLSLIGVGLATASLLIVLKRGRSVSHPELKMDEWSWRVDSDEDYARTVQGGLAYSVVVVALNPHPSNLFRDRRRVEAHSRGVVSVKFAPPNPKGEPKPGAVGHLGAAFFAGHDERADRNVRIIHIADLPTASRWKGNQTVHLKATCGDPSERTVLLITDETCRLLHLPSGLPAACWNNVARNYPYNTPKHQLEQRDFYVPLGPRDTFPYVPPGMVSNSSSRPHLLNLVVNNDTSPRRPVLIDIVGQYKTEHPHLDIYTEPKDLDPKQWQDLLLSSKFTVTPGGHNPETFRMFEALEAGSIPIVSKEDYTNPAFHRDDRVEACGTGDVAWNTVVASPFSKAVSVESWAQLPELLDTLQDVSDDYINQLQADCGSWYDALLNRTYFSLLRPGDGLEMWPQAGPVIVDERGNL